MTAFWGIAAVVFALDLATKHIVRVTMPLGTEIHLLPFFSLTHVKNTGIAFGMFPQMNVVFLVVGLGVAIALSVVGRRLRTEDPFSALVIAGVLGGALGNLLDRAVYGQVTDFLDFYLGAHHWPVFNLADSAICVGAGLLIWRNFRKPAEADKPARS